MFNNILLTKRELNFIYKNVKVSKHAFERARDYIDKDITISKIKNIIKNSPFAWKQSNGQYVVAVDEFSYFVLYRFFNSYMLVSYLRKSDNNYNVIDKFIFEYKGVKKKWKDTEKTRTPSDF